MELVRSTYTYQTGSNRLSSITGANPSSFTSDANGNTLSENAKIFTYNQNQRLIQAVATQTGNYVYNANGQRVKKTVDGAVTVFHYDQNGLLIGESSASGAVQAEYVYLNGVPLAKIDAGSTQYIHADHLGTPVMMTDAACEKVWEIENRPFGDGATVTGTATLNLRFPGQYYDAESGLNYNYFRDYNPAVGRYVQADPIGTDSGDDNIYVYVQNNPLNLLDPWGLETVVIVGGATPNNPFGHVAIGFTGQGVYSYGTDTPLGSSVTEYLTNQAKYRDSAIYILKTTPKQEAKMRAEILKYRKKRLPNPRKDPFGARKDTCATRTQKALEAGDITTIFLPFTSPFPGDTEYIARRNGATPLIIPKGSSIPNNLSRFNK